MEKQGQGIQDLTSSKGNNLFPQRAQRRGLPEAWGKLEIIYLSERANKILIYKVTNKK